MYDKASRKLVLNCSVLSFLVFLVTYDLSLELKNADTDGNQTVYDALIDWFSSQSFTTIDGQSALYENEATGVYLYWDWDAEDGDPLSDTSILDFSINLFRPSAFIFEALSELSALKQHFDLEIFDHQSESDGPTSAEIILFQYQKSGASTAKAVLEQVEEDIDYYVLD